MLVCTTFVQRIFKYEQNPYVFYMRFLGLYIQNFAAGYIMSLFVKQGCLNALNLRQTEQNLYRPG